MVLIFGLETTNPKHTLETRFILNDVFGLDDISLFGCIGHDPDRKGPRYKECILTVPWDFTIQCNLDITNFYNFEVLGITNDFLYLSNSKVYEKYPLYLTKPRYSEQILPVPWPFVISRFHSSC